MMINGRDLREGMSVIGFGQVMKISKVVYEDHGITLFYDGQEGARGKTRARVDDRFVEIDPEDYDKQCQEFSDNKREWLKQGAHLINKELAKYEP